MILFFDVGATAETTNTLSDAEIQGRALAQKILEQRPTENSTNTGVLQIRDGKGNSTKFPIKCDVIVTPTNWASIYDVVLYETDYNAGELKLTVTHNLGETNTYFVENLSGNLDFVREVRDRKQRNTQVSMSSETLGGLYAYQIAKPFAGSDFSIADLGLEFLHWPEQKVLKRDVHRSRGCTVLESTSPYRLPNGDLLPDRYSRVVSWIDSETLGIVEAYAYDAKGKLLKDFYPKDFKKVDGQWQVQTLVMENVQTGSRSRLDFDLKK
ncbi:MAG TPA: outer membrane lipoprotein-sorting protein [Verrucomicrobiae bacterium]